MFWVCWEDSIEVEKILSILIRWDILMDGAGIFGIVKSGEGVRLLWAMRDSLKCGNSLYYVISDTVGGIELYMVPVDRAIDTSFIFRRGS